MFPFYVDHTQNFSDFSNLVKYQKNDLEVDHGHFHVKQAVSSAPSFRLLKGSKKLPFSHKMELTY